MPSITLEDVPEPLFREIRRRAEQHHRDLSSEILACLEAGIRDKDRVSAKQVLCRAAQLDGAIGGYLTDELLRAVKNEGRL